MTFTTKIREQAIKAHARIVLPEGTEERTLKAADYVLSEGIAEIILLDNVSSRQLVKVTPPNSAKTV